MSRKGGVIKRSVSIAGHRTSVSLEQPFWDELHALARESGRPVQALIGEIDSTRDVQNLSSAIRVYVLAAVRKKSAIPGAAAREPATQEERSAAES